MRPLPDYSLRAIRRGLWQGGDRANNDGGASGRQAVDRTSAYTQMFSVREFTIRPGRAGRLLEMPVGPPNCDPRSHRPWKESNNACTHTEDAQEANCENE